MPKATIVISIYNVQQYMKASVESAIGQTEAAIEIILVDDGSTDGSGALCDSYASQDSRIQVIHKQNGGLSSARNAGIAAAAAPYVLVLDGDDYLHPQAVERLLEVAEKYPSDLVQFRYEEVEAYQPLHPLGEMEITAQSHTPKAAFEQLYREGGVYGSGCTKLFKRELLCKIPFEDIRHEDEMWCTRAFPLGLTITYIPDILYGYVMRQGSIIRSTFQPSRMDILKVKEERLQTLKALQLSDLEVKEWNSLFMTLFLLYWDARLAGNQSAGQTIISYFKKYEIIKKVKITGKMKLFCFLAQISPCLAMECYYTYWRVKR